MQALSVQEAQHRILDHVACRNEEIIPLEQAHKRIVSKDIVAKMSQPPFPASAMDGYCVISSDFKGDVSLLKDTDDRSNKPFLFKEVGVSRAGHPFEGIVQAGETVRIFTGAQIPEPCDAIVLQEDCSRADDNTIVVKKSVSVGTFVRPLGYDFTHGDILVPAGTALTYRHLALIASMNVSEVWVVRRPRVAIVATGDELVMPGQELGPGQIVSSVPFGLRALIEDAGGMVEVLGIARDNLTSLAQMIDKAQTLDGDKGFDVLITIGGASVGDHDWFKKRLWTLG